MPTVPDAAPPVVDQRDVPALLERADLAYWLSAVDVIPIVGTELETRPVDESDFGGEKPKPGRLYWSTEQDEDDLDDDMDVDLDDPHDEKALAREWQELAESVGRLVDPRLRLSDDQRDALQNEANRAWEAAVPLVAALGDALTTRGQTRDALRELEMHKPGTVAVDRAKTRSRKAEARACDLLSKVIGRGLERRHGLYLRQDDDRVLKLLRSLGGREPAGIVACDGCGLVFTPSSTATKCERCHGKPRTPALASQRLEGGGYIFYTPALTLRTHLCEVCGGFFNPEKASALTCSDSCDRIRRRENARRRRAAE